MAFRFKRRESPDDAFRRIVDEEFLGLTEALAAADPGIHEARRRSKKLRALVALVAAALDVRAARRADEALAKIARALAPVRDAEARRETLATLLARSDPRARQRFAAIESLLAAQADSARRLTLTPADLRDVSRLIEDAQMRLRALSFTRRGWRAIGPGLRRTYRRGRKALAAALDDPTPEPRHCWRRRVKRLAAHFRLLQNLQPRKLAALARRADQLATLLGDEHDLALLRQHLASHAKRTRTHADYTGITTLLDRRRAALRRRADRLGRTLYRAKPAAFTARLERAWRRWRA
jgi:hypothetical protein